MSAADAATDVSDQEIKATAEQLHVATSIQHKRLMRPLSYNFRAAQAAYLEVESSRLPGNDAGLQKRVGEGLALCEASLVQVESESIFSSNELGEDINTGDLKYLLLPFWRGELLLRVCDQAKRREALREALKTLRGFLADQERLELLAPEAKGWREMGSSASADPAAVRTGKIARMKAGKAAKQRMEVLAGKLKAKGRPGGGAGGGGAGGGSDSDDAGDDDAASADVDELEREQLRLMLQVACHTGIDSIRAAEQEAEMLDQIEKVRRSDGSLPPKPTVEEEDPSQGLQFLSLLPQPGGGPGILGGNSVGGQPTGPIGPLGLRTVDPWKDPSSRLSYATAMHQIHSGEIPGLYTFTVEEGLRMEEAERAMGEAQRMTEMGERAEAKVQAKLDRQEGNDEEDEEERLKLIKQDEFRETNRRGWGNRKNRS